MINLPDDFWHEQAQRQHNADAHPALKLAYAQGAEDAQMMMDSEAGGGEPTLPGAEGGDPAAGGTPASPEEIAQALMMLVQSGEIDEATAQQVLASLGAGGGGDPMAGAGGGGGEMPVPEEAAGADMAKAASALVEEVFNAPAK